MTKVHLQADSFIEFVSHKSLIWSVVLSYPGFNLFLFHRDQGRWMGGVGVGCDSHHRCRKSFFESWGTDPVGVFSQPLSVGYPH